MATQVDSPRFFQKYRSVLVCIGVLILAQTFLSLLCFLHLEDNQTSGQKDHGQGQTFGRSTQGKLSSDDGGAKAQIPVRKSKTSSPSSSLRLESLNFTPDCKITLKDSISAIHRAKTQQCKERLAKSACKLQEETVYPKRLPRFCQNNGYSYLRHIGCYQDQKTNRILNDSFVLKKETNSPRSCTDVCLQSGFLYAGLQYSVECFCGNQRPALDFLLDPNLCNMKCPSVDHDIETVNIERNFSCGGYFAMDVYETGMLHNDETLIVQGLPEISEAISNGSVKGTARVVFFLTLNGRALRQVIRLIKVLFHEKHFFYIHVDARQDYLFRELLALSHKLPANIRFMTERKGSIWGGASLLTVLLNGMKELVNRAEEWNWPWDYVINLSESDFPLKSLEKLEIFLTLNKGRNFVKSHGRDVLKFIQKQGLDKTFYECEFRMWRMGDRVLPAGIFMDGGSDWIALHREFVQYLVHSEDDLVNGLRTVFNYTLLPAESFFHTVLRNSAMCKTFVDNNLHVTNWKRKLGCKCQYRNIVDWCGCSPNDFRSSDWSRLQMTESRLIFFGRKFESMVNQGIVNQLESVLYPERHKQNFATLDRYWQSIYHHYDLSPKPDNALLALGYSLARNAINLLQTKFIKFNEQSTSRGIPAGRSKPFVHLLEISTYMQDDRNQGILVRFRVEEHEDDAHQFEAWFSLQSWISQDIPNENLSRFHSKILSLRVGTDYDQKEQIFRNFAGAMGPKSEPTLAYSCLTEESFNITFAWVNSAQYVQSKQNLTIDTGETANFIKPTFRVQLNPGVWKVKLFDVDGLFIAQTEFLILPSAQIHGEESTITLSRKYKSSEADDEDIAETDQQDATDHLVSKFYTLQDLCLEKENNKSMYHSRSKETADADSNNIDEADEITLCSHSQWSSRYPDPKSTIVGIDRTTGLLLP